MYTTSIYCPIPSFSSHFLISLPPFRSVPFVSSLLFLLFYFLLFYLFPHLPLSSFFFFFLITGIQIIVLHALSKIQPHVNIALSVLTWPDDNVIDFSIADGDYEYIRNREVVMVMFSVAHAEEMKLGLGSVVTLDHW